MDDYESYIYMINPLIIWLYVYALKFELDVPVNY